MGAANVGAVLLTWHDLSHRAHRVLVAMAHMSLDTPRDGSPACRYFGGPGYLAEVLYGPAGLEGRDDHGDPIPTVSARRQVEKCITELVRAGALQRVVKGAPGRRATYLVVLTRPTESVGGHPTNSVGDTRPNRSNETTDSVGPRNHRNHEEQGEDKITFLNHSKSRATPVDVDPESSWELSEQYDAAYTHLKRTLGMTEAASRVATILGTDPNGGYRAAVVKLARTEGWGGP